jgi:hypothetical protein
MTSQRSSARNLLRTDLEIAANMLPNTEYFSQEDSNREVARCIYLSRAKAAGTPFPAFAARIQELLDYQVHTYCDLALACAMKILATDTSRPHEYQIPLLGAQDFSTTGIPVNIAASFLDGIASDEQTFARTINESGRDEADLSAFREKPLNASNERYLTLDIAYVLDKAGRSLFWTALKNAPEKERNQLLVDWGKLLERYLNLLLSENLGPQSTLVPNPRFDDGAEDCDAAIQEGRTLIMMEYKASTISNAIKYADDPTLLQKVLEERFIVGTEQGRKGLAQLWEAIRRFTQGDALVCPVSNTTISAESVHTIVPVLVHLDNALRTPGLPNYMKARFKELGRIKTHTMLPLTLLPISELEQMEGHMLDYVISGQARKATGEVNVRIRASGD